MKTIILLPLLILFGGWGINFSDPHVSYSRPYPSATVRPQTTVSATSSKTVTTRAATTTRAKPKPAPAVITPAPPQSTPTPVSTTIATPAPLASLATQIEERIVALMNTERTKQGLSPLSSDTRLAAISREHSKDMITRNYFDHNDPNGCGSSCRANAANYAWSSIGENIYMFSGYSLDADKAAAMVVNGWMNSPGHRANILGNKYTHSGVGVIIEGTSVYVTAMYAKPR